MVAAGGATGNATAAVPAAKRASIFKA